jgi:SAM-dependent methyltransferase
VKPSFDPKKYWEQKILGWELLRYSPWLFFHPPSWPLRTRLRSAKRILLARLAAGGSILELGCGGGVFARGLEGHGFVYVGLDWAGNAIVQAQLKKKDKNFQFRVANVLLDDALDASVTVFLGLTDWISQPDLCGLLMRIKSPQILFSYTETSAVSFSPYRIYRYFIDGGKIESSYRAITYSAAEIRRSLEQAGFLVVAWKAGNIFNPGVLVWAMKKP